MGRGIRLFDYQALYQQARISTFQVSLHFDLQNIVSQLPLDSVLLKCAV